MCAMDMGAHDGEIADHRDEPVGKVKTKQFASLGRVVAAVAAVSPSGMQVPKKVVKQREFDGGGSGKQVVPAGNPVEQRERGKLHNHAGCAYAVELPQRMNKFMAMAPGGRAALCGE